MKWTEVLAIWFIISVIATPFIGQWLHRRRIRNELRNLLETSDADWAVKHREWMARRRSGQEVKLSRNALIEIAEEESKAFALDENEQPHLPRAS